MNVKLLSAYTEPTPNYVPSWIVANCDTSGHNLVEDAEEADIIIFAESYASLDPFFFDVVRHPLYRRYSDKCVLYHYSDLVPTLCRTISPSVEFSQPNLHFRRSFHYIARRRDNPGLEFQPKFARYNPGLLYSFVGSVRTHPIRKLIMGLQHPRALLRDTSAVESEDLGAKEKLQFHNSYIDMAVASKFVLCPRGIGPTSMRLFEVMQLGRVPVVIGDSWVPVPGVDWNSISLFVPERDIASLPQLLEERESQAEEMGSKARRCWEEKFAPEYAFHHLVGAAAQVLKQPCSKRHQLRNLVPLCNPAYFRMLAGYAKRNLSPLRTMR